jgi:RNA exonuclease 4
MLKQVLSSVTFASFQIDYDLILFSPLLGGLYYTQTKQLIGVNHVETEQKRRRRKRRTNKNIHCDDSSTCATVSSDSSSSGEFHHQPQQKQTQPEKRRLAVRKQHKNQHLPHEELLSAEEQDRYVALDCEFVGLGENGHRSSAARVTLVSWDGTILLDHHVIQEEEVTDYRTFVSGITPIDLETATFTLHDIQEQVKEMIAGKILVGHALKNDLKALGISHPWHATRDTAKYEPFMQVRFDDGILWPRKLKDLVKEKLGRDIQLPGKSHSAYEDAMASLDLYRLVRRKWEKVMDYKIQKTREIESKNDNNKQ